MIVFIHIHGSSDRAVQQKVCPVEDGWIVTGFSSPSTDKGEGAGAVRADRQMGEVDWGADVSRRNERERRCWCWWGGGSRKIGEGINK